MKPSREFQIFAKPAGSRCNLACEYCYYLETQELYPGESLRMSEQLLETYIVQHIQASTEQTILFSWHGGEPTILGLDYFQTIVELQQKHRPPGKFIINGIQTNGTLLDKKWCRFFQKHKFLVGISLDGPKELHDMYRKSKTGKSAFDQTLYGYSLLKQYGVTTEILCVVNAKNVKSPLQVYRYFKQLGAKYISFLPLVEPLDNGSVSNRTVPATAFGRFLFKIFDEWQSNDIGNIKVQIFEEAARTAFKQEHTLCIFKRTCGGVPVVEHNGDFYSCDFFVEKEHRLGNIQDVALVDLLDSPTQRKFGKNKLDTLPQFCRTCSVRVMCNGGCPKNRFIYTPDGEAGLNYLCAGYKMFFSHCRPFVEQVSRVWSEQQIQSKTVQSAAPIASSHKMGRNDPCPCGSGKKYKHCCLKS